MGKDLTAGAQHGLTILFRFCKAAVLFVLCMMCSYVAVAAVVSMQQPGTGGGEVRVPVVLYGDGDEALAGLQFDLQFDPARFELVEVDSGAAAHDAGKSVMVSSPAPGTGRVLITGFNDNVMYDGHVATVVLRPRDRIDGLHSLSIDRILASDPTGSGVDIAYEDLYAFPPAAVPEKAEARDAAAEDPTESESAVDGTQEGDGTTDPAGTGDDAKTESEALDESAQGALSVAANGRSDSERPSGDGEVSPRTRVRSQNRGPHVADDGGHTITLPGMPVVTRPPTAIGSRTGTPRREVANSGPRATASEPLVAGVVQGNRSDRASSQRADGEMTRLALALPTTHSFAPPGAATAAGSDPAGRLAAPEFSRGVTVAAVVLGVVLFAALLALRAVVVDRAIYTRRRRTP